MIGTRSFMAKGAEVERKWYVIDDRQTPWPSCRTVARKLLGNTRQHNAHVETGDFVSFCKRGKSTYSKKLCRPRSSQKPLPGGLKTLSTSRYLNAVRSSDERVVWGMLPKTKLDVICNVNLKYNPD